MPSLRSISNSQTIFPLTVGQYAGGEIGRQTAEAEHGRDSHVVIGPVVVAPPPAPPVLAQAQPPRHQRAPRVVRPGLPRYILVQRLVSHDQHRHVLELPPRHAARRARLARDQPERPLEEVEDLVPKRARVVVRRDYRPAARQADAPSAVVDVDEPTGRSAGLEAVTASAPSDVAHALLAHGGSLRVGQERHPRIVAAITARRGLDVVRAHPFGFEERVLQKLDLGRLGPRAGLRDHRQGLVAHDADPAEVLAVALPVERVLGLRRLTVPRIVVVGGLALGVAERVGGRVDRQFAVAAREAPPVVPPLAAERTSGVDVPLRPDDRQAARVARVLDRPGLGVWYHRPGRDGGSLVWGRVGGTAKGLGGSDRHGAGGSGPGRYRWRGRDGSSHRHRRSLPGVAVAPPSEEGTGHSFSPCGRQC